MSNLSVLTKRQQFWLEHLRSCAAQGCALSAYATEEGLSVGALQQAKMRLHRRGLWPAVRPRFVRVQPATSAVATAAPVVYRVSLPNGVVVESTSGDLSAVWLAQMAMSNAWLKQQGLFSIKEQWTRFHYPTSTA